MFQNQDACQVVGAEEGGVIASPLPLAGDYHEAPDTQDTGPQLLFLTPGPCLRITAAVADGKQMFHCVGENLLEVCHGARRQTLFPFFPPHKNKSRRKNYTPVTLQESLLQQVEISYFEDLSNFNRKKFGNMV